MPADQADPVENAVIHTLKYFNTFQHPLREDEIRVFLNTRVSGRDLSNALQELTSRSELVHASGFYALKGSDPVIFALRMEKNKLAAELMPKARRIAWFLSYFPFVRFIGLSGSLSKNVADANSDFDFFIVTQPGRLWIARTWMHLFKKLSFLTNSQKFYCMNYYLDEDHLCIEDHNRFTAIETATLKPVVGAVVYNRLWEENKWLMSFLPNCDQPEEETIRENRSWLKRGLEGMLNLFFPGWWNTFFMNLTDRKWRAKWKKAGYPDEDYDLAFRTRIYVSKNHPRNFQKYMLEKEKEMA